MMDNFGKSGVEGNLVGRVEELEKMMRALMRKDVQSEFASNVFSSLGDLIDGRFITPTEESQTTDPTSSEFSGWFLAAASQALADGDYQFAKVLLGVVIFGIGDAGILRRGIDFLDNHLATNAGYERRFRQGFRQTSTDGPPSYVMEYLDDAGAELVSNGIDPADLTDWTDSAGAWSVDADMFYHAAGDDCPALLVQNIGGLTAGARYTVSFTSRLDSGYFKPRLKIEWKDSGGSILQTNYIYGDNTAVNTAASDDIVAPASTTQVDISMDPVDSFNSCHFNEISLTETGVTQRFTFKDDDLRLLRAGLDQKLPTILKAEHPGLYVFNTVSETDIMADLTIPGGALLDHVLRITCYGRLANNSAGPQNFIFKPYFGTAGAETLIGAGNATSVATASVFRTAMYELLISRSLRGGNYITVHEAVRIDANLAGRHAHEVAVNDLEDDQNLVITITLGTAAVTNNYLSEQVIIEMIPHVYEDDDVITAFGQGAEATSVDTYIDSVSATTNFGTGATLGIGESNAGSNIMRTLIKPELSSFIGKGYEVVSFELNLVVVSDLSSNARNFKAYHLLRDWIETEATWNVWRTGQNWTTAGAGSNGNDADLTTVLATTSFTGAETAGTRKTFSFDVAEIQKILDGTMSYYGFLLKADTETNDAITFESSSSSIYSRPWWVLRYRRT